MFADTGNIFLDTSSPRLPPREELLCLRARVLGEDRLEVLDANGDALDGDFPAAMGWSALPATRCLMHSGTGLPVLVSGPLAICVALASLGIMVTQPEHPERCTPAECLAGVAMALSVIATSLRRWCEPRTPLRRRLDEYQEKLREANPDPRPCERGAARAIRLEQLLDLCTSFQDFVQKRSMYILEPSIIRPLTVQHKLSYAEVAGPSCVEWFVSHYWGHPFVETCAALEKHARRVTDCPRLWYDAAYWVCTFSNNQYVVQEELGNGQWDRSSFYLALRSDGCRGTCMVLDEDLFPLERSWCLFELLQTMIRVEEHTQEMQNGFGGILFCTSSGIINRGEANSEVSLNMGNKLVTLRLEDAKASSLADKQMIDSLVVSEMGSFDEINGKLRAQFASALAASEASMLDKFALIRSELGAAQTGSRSLAEDSE